MRKSMSKSEEEPVRITTVKQKNPGRVAAGKRLAELSRKRREEKKKHESLAENSSSSWFESCSLIIGVAGLVIAVVSLMYNRKSAEVPVPVVVELNVTVKKKDSIRSRLETLD